MTTARFLVTSELLHGPTAVLTGTELQHLRARRLRIGSELVLSDGLGCQRRGVLAQLDRRRAVINMVAELSHEPLSLRVVLAQALLKSQRLDWVIEKTTELGVSELVVFTCERTVVQPNSERLARWHRVAASAAKQCQRSTLPRIIGPVPFASMLALSADFLRLFFWESAPAGTLPAAKAAHPKIDSVLVAVGPEGGFSASEAEMAARAGWRLITLGHRILRAETASVVVVTLCQHLWGDLGDPAA